MNALPGKICFKLLQCAFLCLTIIFAGCETKGAAPAEIAEQKPTDQDNIAASLFAAIHKNDLTLVKEILSKYKELSSAVSESSEETPLVGALLLGYTSIAEYLLDNFDELNLAFKNPKNGETALVGAIKIASRESEHLPLVQKILRSKDASSVATLANALAETPLMLAIDAGLMGIVKDLLGFISSSDLTNTKYATPGANGQSETPYEFAKRLNRSQVVEELLNVLPVKKAEEEKQQADEAEAKLKADVEEAERLAAELKIQQEAADIEAAELKKKQEKAEKKRKEAESAGDTAEQKRQQDEAEKFKKEAEDANKKAEDLKTQQEQAAQKSADLKKQQDAVEEKKPAAADAARKAAEDQKARDDEAERQRVAAEAAKKAEEQNKKDAKDKIEQERLTKQQALDAIVKTLDLGVRDKNKPYVDQVGSKEIHEISQHELHKYIAIPVDHEFLRREELSVFPKEVVKSKLYIWDHELYFLATDNGFNVYEIEAETNTNKIVSNALLNVDTLTLTKRLGSGTEGGVYQYDIGGKSFAIKIAHHLAAEAQYLERLQFTGLVPRYYGFIKTDRGEAIIIELAEGDLKSIFGKADDSILEKAAHELPKLFTILHTLGIPYDDIKPGNFLVTKSGIKAADIGVGATLGYHGSSKNKLFKSLLEAKIDGLIRPKISDHDPSAKFVKYAVELEYKKYSKGHANPQNILELFDALSPKERYEVIKNHDKTYVIETNYQTGQTFPWLIKEDEIYNTYKDHIEAIYDKYNYNLTRGYNDIPKLCYKNSTLLERKKVIRDQIKDLTVLFSEGFADFRLKILNDPNEFKKVILGTYYSEVVTTFCYAVMVKYDPTSGAPAEKLLAEKLLNDVLNEAFEDAFPVDSPFKQAMIKLRDIK